MKKETSVTIFREKWPKVLRWLKGGKSHQLVALLVIDNVNNVIEVISSRTLKAINVDDLSIPSRQEITEEHTDYSKTLSIKSRNGYLL